MPDVEGKENLSDKTQQELPQHKWNKEVEGAWRLDINVALLKIPTLRKVEEISNSELNRMLRAVTWNWTKRNCRHLKAIVIKYNMIINGLLCAE